MKKIKEAAPAPTESGLFPTWVIFVFLGLAAVGAILLLYGRKGADQGQSQPQVQAQAQPPVQAQPQAAAPTAVQPKLAHASMAPEAPAEDQSQMAPDFTLVDISTGKPFNLKAQRGKVVLVDFWATWCGPCRMAIPHLIELQKQYRDKGLQVVGVSLDQQGPAVVKPFYQSWKMNYAVVVDDQGQVASQYGGIRSIPTALLIDKHGKVITGFVGYRPKEEYETAIKAALAKS